MLTVSPRTRLMICAAVIVLSAGYGVLITKDPDFAQAIMLGYVGILLTIFVLVEVWRHE